MVSPSLMGVKLIRNTINKDLVSVAKQLQMRSNSSNEAPASDPISIILDQLSTDTSMIMMMSPDHQYNEMDNTIDVTPDLFMEMLAAAQGIIDKIKPALISGIQSQRDKILEIERILLPLHTEYINSTNVEYAMETKLSTTLSRSLSTPTFNKLSLSSSSISCTCPESAGQTPLLLRSNTKAKLFK
ncbi:hypothetical protein SAMD00019534_052110 [Acytostelium subglobosum LB1]|uniref:hypothetical protein n=1 Tax=Acytostelium subglobosum LB1 TaxID=1410327 RepID=UPI0006450439|nr:hypothetical protein SAMD00019534_052110 [Acytostelium subglobosum LB1]GAM22036.1 hypothetical protein SAMD00019534_052110 [Acytostelium subglobosum LB1]|eukprot:XP_012755136.1 hypothetical protein SAMD00019534_052110 [Acytostelium subglobosum LB1]